MKVRYTKSERAEAGSSQARDQLSKTTVYSPIDGTVTILTAKLGERIVATGQLPAPK